MKRRTFIQNSLGAAGMAFSMANFPYHLLASDQKKFASDTITLGKTGIKVSRLAMGTGTHGVNKNSDQTRKLGIQGLADLLEAAFDEGHLFLGFCRPVWHPPAFERSLKKSSQRKSSHTHQNPRINRRRNEVRSRSV